MEKSRLFKSNRITERGVSLERMQHVKELLRIAHEVQSGTFDPPPNMVKEIVKWAEAQWAARQYATNEMFIGEDQEEIDRMVDELGSSTDEERKEILRDRIQRIELEIKGKKKTNSERMKIIRSVPNIKITRWKSVVRYFDLDFRGWKHSSIINKAPKENVTLAEHFYSDFSAEITTGKLRRGLADAQWVPSQKRIRITYYGGNLMKKVKHELRHFAQDFLTFVLKRTTQNDVVGLPPKDSRTKEIDQWLSKSSPFKSDRDLVKKLKSQGITKDDFHSLDDVEFYTELSDAIDRYPSKMEYIIRRDEGVIDEREFLRGFVGEVFKDWTNDFFYSLRRGAPGKWRKAVKELVKSVGVPSE